MFCINIMSEDDLRTAVEKTNAYLSATPKQSVTMFPGPFPRTFQVIENPIERLAPRARFELATLRLTGSISNS